MKNPEKPANVRYKICPSEHLSAKESVRHIISQSQLLSVKTSVPLYICPSQQSSLITSVCLNLCWSKHSSVLPSVRHNVCPSKHHPVSTYAGHKASPSQFLPSMTRPNICLTQCESIKKHLCLDFHTPLRGRFWQWPTADIENLVRFNNIPFLIDLHCIKFRCSFVVPACYVTFCHVMSLLAFEICFPPLHLSDFELSVPYNRYLTTLYNRYLAQRMFFYLPQTGAYCSLLKGLLTWTKL